MKPAVAIGMLAQLLAVSALAAEVVNTAGAGNTSAIATRNNGKERSALQECMKENGVTPPPADSGAKFARISHEDREKVQACMKAKGFAKNADSGRKHREEMQACLSAKGIGLPDPSSDNESKWTELDAKTKAAMKACRAEINAKLKAQAPRPAANSSK